jgi:cysteate synthase
VTATRTSAAAAPGAVDGEHPRRHRLHCASCGALLDDDGRVLACPGDHAPALLRTMYPGRRMRPEERAAGLFRYRCWLPVAGDGPSTGPATAVYRSRGLARAAGMDRLWIAVNGHVPALGATLPTGTFKDLEASAVLARLGPGSRRRPLVLASAGNTAAAFARACADVGQRCLLIVPRPGLADLRFAGDRPPWVTVVSLAGGADYTDAIALAGRVTADPASGCIAAGGVVNVARRDGVGTTVLAAAERLGRIPDVYVQAVGSGAGGIAAHEAAVRLAGDGRFGNGPLRLLLAQNRPYTPMVDAWRAGTRDVDCGADARERIRRIGAQVLSSRRPAYAVVGGVHDVLAASGGDMLAVGNAEATAARMLVEEMEGFDIDPAAAVAAASLLTAARRGSIPRRSAVLLNLTGAGRGLLECSGPLPRPRPDLELARDALDRPATVERVLELVA